MGFQCLQGPLMCLVNGRAVATSLPLAAFSVMDSITGHRTSRADNGARTAGARPTQSRAAGCIPFSRQACLTRRPACDDDCQWELLISGSAGGHHSLCPTHRCL